MIYGLLGAAVFVMLLLLWKNHSLKRSAREIREQFAAWLKSDTNAIISTQCGDRDMRRLAEEMNMLLREFRTAKIQYTEGDRELREAVTNISHDLRTPLTAICGYLELLRSEEKSAQAAKYLDIIEERTDIIRAMTEEMLIYSVSVSEKQEMLLETVILNHALEESISAFYGVLTEHSITPQITICETNVTRKLNKTALSRVFSNILSNAVKYSDGNLCITLTETGIITFENHAADLDEITVGKLFQRFYTVENAGKSTGLGLSIAQTLTKQMGGSIQASIDAGMMRLELSFPNEM